MSIDLIVAAAENGAIGREGELPWRLRDDLRHFRAITMGRTVIMGRRTYESLGRPLDGRTNIVITRQAGYAASGCTVVGSLDEALAITGGDACVIGGGQVYAEALPLADTIHLTRVHAAPEADTFFALPAEGWEVVEEAHHPADERNDHAYTFVTLHRSR